MVKERACQDFLLLCVDYCWRSQLIRLKTYAQKVAIYNLKGEEERGSRSGAFENAFSWSRESRDHFKVVVLPCLVKTNTH